MIKKEAHEMKIPEQERHQGRRKFALMDWKGDKVTDIIDWDGKGNYTITPVENEEDVQNEMFAPPMECYCSENGFLIVMGFDYFTTDYLKIKDLFGPIIICGLNKNRETENNLCGIKLEFISLGMADEILELVEILVCVAGSKNENDILSEMTFKLFEENTESRTYYYNDGVL